ncbi:hypothetical protein FRC00_007680 [Tulasnella sp. 408]|nr:hypothetical protein FRC00_007680 [Tulasnella sp. 408]
MENLLEYFDLLQPHSHRWKTLEYLTDIIERRASTHIRNFLESPAPMLQSIEVTLSEFDGEPGLNLAGGVAKELKHVTLRDAMLPEYSNFLLGLETLSLKNNGTVPTREILNIFVKNPALRRFELWCEGAEGESDPAPSATQQLDTVATSLERINILTDHPEMITQILSHVSMPKCKYLELSVLDDDFQILDQALAQFIPRIRQALSLGGRTTLSVESEYRHDWSSSLEDEGFRFFFEWTSISLGSLREWIRGLIGSVESPPELEIVLSTLDRDIVAALGEWNEFEVTKLTINPSSEDEDEVVSLPGFLGDVMVDSDGALSWRFPNLRELDLTLAECGLSEVFGMLNKRYLPDAYVREMEGLGIMIQTPPQIDLRVQNTTGVENATLITALRRHRGVKSLEQAELESDT